MGKLNGEWTQEEIDQLVYDLAIARARVYRRWGFDIDEIALAVDIPKEMILLEFNKDELEWMLIKGTDDEETI